MCSPGKVSATNRLLAQTAHTADTRQPPLQLTQHIPSPHRDTYEEVLTRYAEVFAEADVPSTTISTQHRIILKDETPVRARTYRCSEERKRIINEEVTQMLAQGIIRRSMSNYNSPVVIVKKRDGKQRFCVDYRLLNERTHVEVSHLPPISDTLMELGTAKVFTTLDLKSGYWQVPLAEESRKYTAFSTPDGATYEFTVMPFGLAGAPGTFQKLMVNVLEGYMHRFVKVYLDDVVVYSETQEEHQEHLAKVLERLAVHGLRCSAEKCQIATSQITYLGHVITEAKNLPQQEHLQRIQDFQAPRTIRELRKFMGTANWLRDYVPRFAELAAPLTDLLATKKKFAWGEAAQEAFDRVKEAMARPLELSRPDPNKPFCLQTDASSLGMAAVLFQEEENRRRIIAYASAKFTATERRYHINEQEVLAAVWAIKKYRMFLQDGPFRLYTDNRSLLWLKKYQDERAKLTRWALMLQGYQFEVVHVPGTRNELPDYLSRNPEQAMEEDQPTEDENQHPLLNQIQESTLYEEIAAAQREDDSCQQDRARLQRLAREEPADADERRIREEYALVDDCIWKRTPQQLLLYVPRTLRRRLLEEYHDGPHAAHPGRDETQTAIQQKFWWPKLPRDVAEWVKSCAICAAVKAGPPQAKAPLRPRTPPEPWHTVSLDVLGPYEEAPRHARYAAVLTDTFTKWVEVKSIPTTRAREIVQFLEETFARYGYPACIVTDAARLYLATRWTNYLEQHHIQGYTSPIYHQRANPVERRIQELKKTIRALVIEQPHRWPEALPNALFALRSRTNAATGTSPAVLMFGQPIKRPGEWTMPVEVRPLVEPHNERIARARRRQEVYQTIISRAA
uniref:RNA-directed DNA polymerase n=1 Tax=Anoplophora glabripennis TaxID=217634 RepID=V5GSD8_ANOGL